MGLGDYVAWKLIYKEIKGLVFSHFNIFFSVFQFQAFLKVSDNRGVHIYSKPSMIQRLASSKFCCKTSFLTSLQP
jgi:hypothetical protein